MITLDDYKRQEEAYRKKRKLIYKLPCRHGSITLEDKKGDRIVVCPTCQHKWLLTFSANPKLYELSKEGIR